MPAGLVVVLWSAIASGQERATGRTADSSARVVVTAAVDNLTVKLAEEFAVVALVCALFLWHLRSALVAGVVIATSTLIVVMSTALYITFRRKDWL